MNRRDIRARWRSRLRGNSSVASIGRNPRHDGATALPVQISVTVQELHLRSCSRSDAMRVADAFQQELGIMLAGGEIPAFWSQGAVLDTMRLNRRMLRPGARPQQVGEKLAQALLRKTEMDEGR